MVSSGLRGGVLGLAMALGCWATAASGQTARLTILEGGATLVDGVRRVAAVEGLVLADRTIVQTGPEMKLMRVEWADGTVADFGPDTLAMLAPGALAGSGKGPAFYLLRGWAKQGSLGTVASAGQMAPQFQLPPFKGMVVSFAARGETFLFSESGDISLTERDAKTPARLTLKPGEAYSRTAGGNGATAPRATAEQLRRVPRGFREALPLRAAQFSGKPPTPSALPAPTYADLQPWLSAEPALRRAMPARFAALARDPAFRKGLIDHLADHPEWRPVLYPDPPKEASTATAAPR